MIPTNSQYGQIPQSSLAFLVRAFQGDQQFFTSPTNVRVETQIPSIVDWTPRRTLRNDAEWTFTPSQLQIMCVHAFCP